MRSNVPAHLGFIDIVAADLFILAVDAVLCVVGLAPDGVQGLGDDFRVGPCRSPYPKPPRPQQGAIGVLALAGW
jgi:hypothetical protein